MNGVIMNEYSFQADSIVPYIKYCKDNRYSKTKEENQNRIVYENKFPENIIARITKRIINNKEEKYF